jgi:hypothetical protein
VFLLWWSHKWLEEVAMFWGHMFLLCCYLQDGQQASMFFTIMLPLINKFNIPWNIHNSSILCAPNSFWNDSHCKLCYCCNRSDLVKLLSLILFLAAEC